LSIIALAITIIVGAYSGIKAVNLILPIIVELVLIYGGMILSRS
jgi:hypothetical protein